jgi:hypothetical protein
MLKHFISRDLIDNSDNILEEHVLWYNSFVIIENINLTDLIKNVNTIIENENIKCVFDKNIWYCSFLILGNYYGGFIIKLTNKKIIINKTIINKYIFNFDYDKFLCKDFIFKFMLNMYNRLCFLKFDSDIKISNVKYYPIQTILSNTINDLFERSSGDICFKSIESMQIIYNLTFNSLYNIQMHDIVHKLLGLDLITTSRQFTLDWFDVIALCTIEKLINIKIYNNIFNYYNNSKIYKYIKIYASDSFYEDTKKIINNFNKTNFNPIILQIETINNTCKNIINYWLF